MVNYGLCLLFAGYPGYLIGGRFIRRSRSWKRGSSINMAVLREITRRIFHRIGYRQDSRADTSGTSCPFLPSLKRRLSIWEGIVNKGPVNAENSLKVREDYQSFVTPMGSEGSH
jgi:hypothetical protein